MSDDRLVYTSPTQFSFRQRISLAVIPAVVVTAFKCLLRLTRFEVRGGQHWTDTIERHEGVIFGIFHESLGLAAWQHRNSGFHTLTSHSYDGELAARAVHRFGLKALRGSSTRGGFKALSQLQIAVEQHGTVGLTVDGPRGPRRGVKPGIAILSAKSQVPIVLIAFAVDRAWRLKSWDRFPIPKPFSKIICAYSPPIPPPASAASKDVRATLQRVEQELNAMQTQLETELGSEPMLTPIQ